MHTPRIPLIEVGCQWMQSEAQMVPVVGVEPTHGCPWQILSLLRLPIPPHRQRCPRLDGLRRGGKYRDGSRETEEIRCRRASGGPANGRTRVKIETAGSWPDIQEIQGHRGSICRTGLALAACCQLTDRQFGRFSATFFRSATSIRPRCHSSTALRSRLKSFALRSQGRQTPMRRSTVRTGRSCSH